PARRARETGARRPRTPPGPKSAPRARYAPSSCDELTLSALEEDRRSTGDCRRHHPDAEFGMLDEVPVLEALARRVFSAGLLLVCDRVRPRRLGRRGTRGGGADTERLAVLRSLFDFAQDLALEAS